MNFSTIKKVFLAAKNLPGLVLIILFGLSSLSCASSTNGNFSSDSLNKENDKYLSFYEKENDKNVHREVNFENEDVEIKISTKEILVDGEKLHGELLDKYKNIYKKYMGKDLSETSNIHIH